MTSLTSCALSILLAGMSAFAAATDDVYLLGPDSQSREGVPKGNVIGPLIYRREMPVTIGVFMKLIVEAQEAQAQRLLGPQIIHPTIPPQVVTR